LPDPPERKKSISAATIAIFYLVVLGIAARMGGDYFSDSA
jgi:hypothetical protein